MIAAMLARHKPSRFRSRHSRSGPCPAYPAFTSSRSISRRYNGWRAGRRSSILAYVAFRLFAGATGLAEGYGAARLHFRPIPRPGPAEAGRLPAAAARRLHSGAPNRAAPVHGTPLVDPPDRESFTCRRAANAKALRRPDCNLGVRGKAAASGVAGRFHRGDPAAQRRGKHRRVRPASLRAGMIAAPMPHPLGTQDIVAALRSN